ncbi:MAG TPA: hypothetical protein PKW86_08560 [bacterium]|nr:hypothetical protein [bacterium]
MIKKIWGIGLFWFLINLCFGNSEHFINIKKMVNKGRPLTQQEAEELRKYVLSLNFEDIIKIGEEIAEEMGPKWSSDNGYVISMGMILGPYFEEKKIDIKLLLKEMKINSHSPALRSFLAKAIVSDLWEERNIYKGDTSQEEMKIVNEYILTAKEILKDRNEDDEFKSYLISTLGELSNIIKKEAIVDETVEIFFERLNNPQNSDKTLIPSIRILSFIAQGETKVKRKERLKEFLLGIFHNRKLYSEKVQTEIALRLVYTFECKEILEELKKMENEIKDIFLKKDIQDLIKNIEEGRIPLKSPSSP